MGHWRRKHWRLGTTATGSVHYQCAVQVRTIIRAMGLPSIAEASIELRAVPLDRDIVLPAILIVMRRQSMPPAAGNNLQDDITYGVLVGIVAADNMSHDHLDTYTLWIEQIRRAFHCRRLPNVASVYSCHAQPLSDVIDEGAWYHNAFSSGLLLNFISRESRG